MDQSSENFIRSIACEIMSIHIQIMLKWIMEKFNSFIHKIERLEQQLQDLQRNGITASSAEKPTAQSKNQRMSKKSI